MPQIYPFADRKMQIKKICASYALSTDCPVFEVKTRINVLVSSDVLNRSKSTDFNTKCFRFFVCLEAKTRCDYMTKNQPSNNLFSLLNEQILHFHCVGGKVTVEPGISI